MSFSAAPIYQGDIDWNKIYRDFYPLDDMKRRIRSYLPHGLGQPVIMAGFGELAADLATEWPIGFVEYSLPMAEAAKVDFPDLNNVIYADVLDHLNADASPIVLILCRVSAYWQDETCFDRLITGLAAHPRQLVLIDFFDSTRLRGETKFEMLVGANNKTDWHFADHRKIQSDPTITLAKLNGRFDDGGPVIDFNAELAFFDPDEVRHSLGSAFGNCEITIEPPLVADDPSFLVMMQAT